MKVAILGATSHIAKNLIVHFPHDAELFLFARAVPKMQEFLAAEVPSDCAIHTLEIGSFSQFSTHVDLLINCVGFGTPEKLRTAGIEIFTVTEKYDDQSLAFVQNHRITYVNFSSGAIYGPDTPENIGIDAEFRIRLSSIESKDAYRISKLNSEAKHRILEGLAIYDLRLFSFFSRHMDMASSYLISDMIRAIREKREFETDRIDIVRDYVHPSDLADLVWRCAKNPTFNGPLDVYSKEPVRKSQMIDAFEKHFGLRVKYNDTARILPLTGQKRNYASHNHFAGKLLQYFPHYSSLEALMDETEHTLSRSR